MQGLRLPAWVGSVSKDGHNSLLCKELCKVFYRHSQGRSLPPGAAKRVVRMLETSEKLCKLLCDSQKGHYRKIQLGANGWGTRRATVESPSRHVKTRLVGK